MVGAGLAGLAAAAQLVGDGHDVVVGAAIGLGLDAGDERAGARRAGCHDPGAGLAVVTGVVPHPTVVPVEQVAEDIAKIELDATTRGRADSAHSCAVSGSCTPSLSGCTPTLHQKLS